MENNSLKCLICQDPYPQEGITFFQFPKEETRFKAWVRAVTPLLDISDLNNKKVEDDLRESGRICGKHFKEKDFINYKKDSLIHTACPYIGVPDNVPVDVEVQLNIVETFDDKNLVNLVDKILPENDSDIFKCGKCKAQFSVLSDFFNHKKSNCLLILNNNNDSVKNDNPQLLDNLALTTGGTFLLNFENGISLNNCNLQTENNSGDLNNLTDDGNDDTNQNDMVSFIVSDNSLLIGNPVDISLLTSQLLLTSNVQNDNLDDSLILPPVQQDPPQTSLLLTTNVQNEGDDVPAQSSLILTTSLPNQMGTSNLLLTTDIPDENGGGTGLLITTEAPLNTNPVDITSELDQGEPQDIILNLQLNPISNENDCAIVNNLLIPDLKENQKDINRTQCSYCGKIFKKPFSVHQHERIHTGEKPFQCIVCGRAFSQKANVRKHMVRHKVWPKAKQTLKINLNEQCKAVLDQKSLENNCYACQYCSSTFETYFLHKKHMAVHADQKVYRCIQKNCNETFRDLDEFLSHSETHATAEFQCHVCFKVFTNLEALGAHQYEHGTSVKTKPESQMFKCEKCYANFKCAESLKNHLAIESHNYECPQCKIVFTSERFLRRHVLSHLDPSKSKYKCDKCKKVFRTEKYLASHSFIHSKEKPFSCNDCDKKFASRYRLKRHLALHSGRYFECPFKSRLGCDKKFYRKDKLCDHVATHSNFKFRSCHICNKTFTSIPKLNLHMKRDHMINEGKQQVLKCLNCSQTFRKEKQLSQHHCTVGERKFKSRIRNKSVSDKNEENERDGNDSQNIEIMLVPFVSGTGSVS